MATTKPTMSAKRIIIYCLNYYETKEMSAAGSFASQGFVERLEEAREWIVLQETEEKPALTIPPDIEAYLYTLTETIGAMTSNQITGGSHLLQRTQKWLEENGNVNG